LLKNGDGGDSDLFLSERVRVALLAMSNVTQRMGSGYWKEMMEELKYHSSAKDDRELPRRSCEQSGMDLEERKEIASPHATLSPIEDPYSFDMNVQICNQP